MQIQKIKKTREFSKIYNNSKKVYTRHTIIFIKENENKGKRFGFVASKKTGKAVQRNRIKRIFREIIRNNKEKFKENTDYIFVGKSNLKDQIEKINYKDIEKDILRVMK